MVLQHLGLDTALYRQKVRMLSAIQTGGLMNPMAVLLKIAFTRAPMKELLVGMTFYVRLPWMKSKRFMPFAFMLIKRGL